MSILAIDYGERRIGLAWSSGGVLAMPHSVIRNRGNLDDVAGVIGRLGRDLDVSLYVLGIPRGRRHDAEAIEAKFSRIADAIRKSSGREVILWDESLTTAEAASLRREAGKTRRNERAEIDMHAAAVLLQSYLDHQNRRESTD